MTFAERLKKHRIENQMTMQALADKLGWSAQMISQYESGNRNPKASTIKKIAAALEISENDLNGINDTTNELFEKDILDYGRVEKTIREHLDIPPETVANELGWTLDELTLFESGKKTISLKQVAKIAAILKILPSDLLQLSNNTDLITDDTLKTLLSNRNLSIGLAEFQNDFNKIASKYDFLVNYEEDICTLIFSFLQLNNLGKRELHQRIKEMLCYMPYQSKYLDDIRDFSKSSNTD